MDLTIVWIGLIGIAILAYVILDGFDLGLAILFPFFRKRQDRDVMMNSVAPVWDGNETWLILGGGALFAAFPLAYAILMPAVYAPVTAMLLGLIFRGVAFEYRWRTERLRVFWEAAFTGGSFVAALAQGITLGAILQGVDIDGREYSGGWWDWLTPFSLLTGISVVVGYSLLGACWLIMKTRGSLQDKAFRLARWYGIGMLLCIFAVSLATVFLEESYYHRWFDFPAILLTSQIPLLTAIAAFALFWALRKRRDYAPFLIALSLFGLTFAGLMVSIFPYMVPNRITIWDAAAPHSSQLFMLVGAAVLLPIIIAYTAYSYWVFRGKVDPDAGYH